jgi:hypothetical protein
MRNDENDDRIAELLPAPPLTLPAGLIPGMPTIPLGSVFHID